MLEADWAEPIGSQELPAHVLERVGHEVTETTSPHAADPVRAAAGRRGALRVQELARLGLEYERAHGLSVRRQRRRQLIQLGRRYEQELGLAAPRRVKRKPAGDAWEAFLRALKRVVKSTHRPRVDALIEAIASPPAPVVGTEPAGRLTA